MSKIDEIKKAMTLANVLSVKRINFSDMSDWKVDERTGNISHATGKFFKVEGIRVKTEYNSLYKKWEQPIINQQEVGILGILIKKFDGIPHFLLQIKIEPGNLNSAQVSPTVQATFSNYTQVHKGKRTLFLDYFLEQKNKVIFDQLQSEQGARFYKKRNRNILVEIDDEVEVPSNFFWVSMSEVKQLLKMDNVVNMEARSVLSGINYYLMENISDLKFSKDIAVSLSAIDGINTKIKVFSWFASMHTKFTKDVELVPLNDIQDWIFERDEIRHETNNYFSVIAVDIQTTSREVAHWTQPLLKLSGIGLVGFITKKINGILHFLIQAKLEAGYFDSVEIAPTVSTSIYSDVDFIDLFLKADEELVKFSAMLSEEGGRFYHAQNRYMIIETYGDLEIPENYVWMTLNQIFTFLQYNNCVNTEARTLLACIDA